MDIKRGEIYYIDKNPTYYAVGSEQYSSRPAIVISCNKVDQALQLAQVVYLTTQPKSDAPSHVMIRSQEKNCIALCEQIFTVSTTRIKNYMGKITDAEQKTLDAALMAQLGLSAAPAEPKEDALEQVLEEIRQLRQDIKSAPESAPAEEPKQKKRDEVPVSEFGAAINEYRKRNRLTIFDLAKRTELAPSTISRVITLRPNDNREIKRSTLIAIAHVCEIYGEEADRLIELRLKGE